MSHPLGVRPERRPVAHGGICYGVPASLATRYWPARETMLHLTFDPKRLKRSPQLGENAVSAGLILRKPTEGAIR